MTLLPVAFFDTECYPNYWLLKFRPFGGATLAFRLREGQAFPSHVIVTIQTLFESFTVISFNGLGYDVPMITAALLGYTPAALKQLNDRIIVEKVKPWELGLPEWKPVDHIDIMEVLPGMGSQKQYAARIHCKTIRDLPYDPGTALTEPQIGEIEVYCENDLDNLAELFVALGPQIEQRIALSERYGIDLRSKSDAQLAEAVLKRRCEQELGHRVYKPDVDWSMQFRYQAPHFIGYSLPVLQDALMRVLSSVFRLGANGAVEMPAELASLAITIGASTYKLGIGGLHSQEASVTHYSDDSTVLRDADVAAYYPTLIINSGKYPQALGPTFIREYSGIKDERVAAKHLQAKLKKSGQTSTAEYRTALVGNEGGKIMINGTFGKTGSPYSVLFAPTMLIQTTLTGQLSLLMLIEWHEHYGIPIVSANTDGIVIKCPRDRVDISDGLIAEWQRRTGLEMEIVEYKSIHSRDVNNYFAVKSDGDVKRKGEYARAGLIEKKNPDLEICGDAVAEFLARGVPVEQTIRECRDIRKFLAVQRVSGGGVKLWGDGPRKGTLVRDMTDTLVSNGWTKTGRLWARAGVEAMPTDAYHACFAPQRPEYLGKVVRWYYSTNAPGPIVYASNGNTVSLSYGAKPCMVLPDEFPADIDYAWYVEKCRTIMVDIALS